MVRKKRDKRFGENIMQKELELLIEEEAEKQKIKLDGIEFCDKYQYNFGENKIYLSADTENKLLKQEINDFINGNNLNLGLEYNKPEITEEFTIKLIKFLALHELRHAKQNQILTKEFESYNKTQVKYLLISLLKATDFIKMIYHDKLYYEFDANMNASLYFKNDPVMEKYLAYKFLQGYTNKPGRELCTPLETNQNTFGTDLNALKHIDVAKFLLNHNDDIINSMELGFTIKNDEMNKIIKLYRG